MRFSLKELLIVFTVASLGVPALLYASPPVVAIASLATLSIGVAMALNILSPSPRRRAMGIGFALASLVYSGMLNFGDEQSTKYVPTGPKVTSFMMSNPYSLAREGRGYWSNANGDRLEGPSPRAITQEEQEALWNGSATSKQEPQSRTSRTSGVPRRVLRYVEVPDRNHFMAVAHCLWTLLFGYLGGKYAVWVFTRLEKEDSVNSRDTMQNTPVM